MKNLIYLSVVLIALVFLSSCKDDTEPTFPQTEYYVLVIDIDASSCANYTGIYSVFYNKSKIGEINYDGSVISQSIKFYLDTSKYLNIGSIDVINNQYESSGWFDVSVEFDSNNMTEVVHLSCN